MQHDANTSAGTAEIATPAPANPLLEAWHTPYGLPPFDAVRDEHFLPAFEQALREHRDELDAIAANPAAPDFDNTVAAFDRSARLMTRLAGLFFNLASSETSPALQAVERELAPRLAGHDSAIYLNAALFARIDAVHAQRSDATWSSEQRRMAERVHLDFVRAGARLAPEGRRRHAELKLRLATLQTRFGQNVLADEAAYRLELRGEADLAGLPDFVRAAAREAARERGCEADGVITLSRSHIVPFLTFSERSDLREQAWRAWTTRGERGGEHDNRDVAGEILALRQELARLHDKASYADFALADTMAGTQAAVGRLLERVWQPALARAQSELEALRGVRLAHGQTSEVEPWDWRHLAEKVRQARFGIDEAAIKPYFPLERMVDAMFECAQRLFGLRFVAQPQVRAYHPDVQVYEVQEAASGRLVGVFLHDNFARPTKRSGAWMSSYREQSRHGGDVLPIVVNNNNFAKGAPGAPTLLSFDDARTLFHEFGHGLHGLLSDVTYERLSGTSVLRDFVELPSQIFENWLEDPGVLARHARHYRTGEAIPTELVRRLLEARTFNQGYETVRYAASALVDMAAHARTDGDVPDITALEDAVVERIGLPRCIGMNHRLAHFQHLFAGSSYAAGYYVYLWAEVLDADGFGAFVEAGDPFDPAVAERLRRFIYAAGNSVDPVAAFRAFRGRDPAVEPMLRKRGLSQDATA